LVRLSDGTEATLPPGNDFVLSKPLDPRQRRP
jgi:hypothetical protein